MPKISRKKKEDDGEKSRAWMFTINNYTDSDISELSSLVSAHNGPSFVCAGKEVAPTTGTPHLQCFAIWSSGGTSKSGQRWSFLRNRLTRASDIAGMYSTKEACITYCEKDNDVMTWGVKPELRTQGKRNDLNDARILLEEGRPMVEVAQAHFGSYCRYHRAFEKYAAMQSAPRNWKPEVIWLHGASGSGKTRWCWANYPDLVPLEFQKGFWSRYSGQETVLLDDYDHSQHKEETICRMLDRYPFQLRQLGSFVNFIPKTILITSNYPPPQSTRMLRRIDKVKEFSE